MAVPRAILQEWDLGARVLSLCADGRGSGAAARLEGGRVAFARIEDSGDDPHILCVDDAGVLALCPDADDHAFLAVGASGNLFILEAAVHAPTPLVCEKGMTMAAAAKNGPRAFACGNTVRFLDDDGKIVAKKDLHTKEPVTSLVFDSVGKRCAAGYASGALVLSLADGKTATIKSEKSCDAFLWDAKGDVLFAACAGGYLGVWKEGEGRFSFGPLLPAWSDGSAPIFCGFTARDAFLALGGAGQGIFFPLSEKRSAAFLSLGDLRAQKRVVCIASHPLDPFAVLGYDDGAIVLAPFDGRSGILVHPPVLAPVTGIVWNGSGESFLASFGDGRLILVTQKSLHAAVRARL